LQKINEISNTLDKEVSHYCLFAKKYKQAKKKIINWSAAGSNVLLAAFSSASFGLALFVVGLPATVSLSFFRADSRQQKTSLAQHS